DFLEDLQIISGVRFREQTASNERGTAARRAPIGAGTAVELEPVDGHPLMEGVEMLRGYSDGESALWRPIMPESASMLLLRLAAERSSGLDAGWERRYGNGHIVVVASGTILTNHLVADSDAGRFLSNAVRHHVRADG